MRTLDFTELYFIGDSTAMTVALPAWQLVGRVQHLCDSGRGDELHAIDAVVYDNGEPSVITTAWFKPSWTTCAMPLVGRELEELREQLQAA